MSKNFNVLVKDVATLAKALTNARSSQIMINGSPQVNSATYLSAYYSIGSKLFNDVMENKSNAGKVGNDVVEGSLPFNFFKMNDGLVDLKSNRAELFRSYMTSISTDYLRLGSYIYTNETSLRIADLSNDGAFSFISVKEDKKTRNANELDLIEYKANFLVGDVSCNDREPDDLSCYKIAYIMEDSESSYKTYNALMVANELLGFSIKSIDVLDFEIDGSPDHFVLFENDVNNFLSNQSSVSIELNSEFTGNVNESLVVTEFVYLDSSGNRYLNLKKADLKGGDKSLIDDKYFILSEDFFDLFMKAIQMSISLVGVVDDGDKKRTFTTVDVISFCMATSFDLEYSIDEGSVLSSSGILKKHLIDLKDYKSLIHNSISNFIESDADGSLDYDSNPSEVDLMSDLTLAMESARSSGHYNGCLFREDEISEVINGIEKYNRNNVVIVGDSGVGLTNLLYGFVDAIKNGESAKLSGRPVFLVNYQEIISGTRLRGEFEDRVRQIRKEAASRNAIVIIEDIGLSENDSGNLETIKSQLSKNVSLVMVASNKDYIKHQSFFRNFSRVNVEELDIKQTVSILKDIKPSYENFHNVHFSSEVISQIVDLSNRYITNQKLPYKAVNLMDLVGAKKSDLSQEEKVDISIDDVVGVLSRISKIDRSSIHITEIIDDVSLDLSVSKQIINNLESKLKGSIFGQEKAIDDVVSSVLIARSGLSDETKPMASFLFVGPTGVGKTELVKVMAKELSMNLVRIDMSEYMDKTSVNKLIGSSAGYVGYGDGGVLTNQVFNNPNSIILLDEVEKANPDVLNVFLQIMDNGIATDGSGNSISFRNCIIVMTSNAGVNKTVDEKNRISFSGTTVDPNIGNKSGINMEQVEKVFSPEFRNRIDMIIEFNYIDDESINSIIKKSLDMLYEKVKGYGVTIDIDDDVMALVREKGYNKDLGARPLYRYVKDNIVRSVAKVLMVEGTVRGDKIKASVEDGEIVFNVVKESKKIKRPVRKATKVKVLDEVLV